MSWAQPTGTGHVRVPSMRAEGGWAALSLRGKPERNDGERAAKGENRTKKVTDRLTFKCKVNERH